MTAGFVTKVLLMVHPFSNSLFTPSIFHTDEYDLEASPPTDSASLNDSVILEADALTSTLDENIESLTEYVMTTESESRRAVQCFTSSNSSRETDVPTTLDSASNNLVPRWDHSGDWDSAIPECSMEQKLGEVGVEAQMSIPAEMLWLNPPIFDPGLTTSILPARLVSDFLSSVDHNQNDATSLTFQTAYDDPSCQPAMQLACSPATSTLQGATESHHSQTETLTDIPSHPESLEILESEAGNTPINSVLPLLI